MPTSQYLALDQLDAYTFYGVKVCTLGEDGDMGEIAFTHDTQRAIAAAAALYRKEYGVRASGVQVVGEPQWWRIVDNCGCDTTCVCPLDTDGDPVHDCEHFGLPPCLPEGFAWKGLACTGDDSGALPVLTLEVSDRPSTGPTWTARGEQAPGLLVHHWPDIAPAASDPAEDRETHV